MTQFNFDLFEQWKEDVCDINETPGLDGSFSQPRVLTDTNST